MDMYHNFGVAQSLGPAAYTASANGSGVDLQNFGAAMVVISAGTITDGTHTFEVQESDDNSAFTAVADADLIGSEPALTSANSNSVTKIGYIGNSRYLRVAVTVAGATDGGVYEAAIVEGEPRKAPVS